MNTNLLECLNEINETHNLDEVIKRHLFRIPNKVDHLVRSNAIIKDINRLLEQAGIGNRCNYDTQPYIMVEGDRNKAVQILKVLAPLLKITEHRPITTDYHGGYERWSMTKRCGKDADITVELKLWIDTQEGLCRLVPVGEEVVTQTRTKYKVVCGQ